MPGHSKINNPLAKLAHDYFSKHILESILFSSVILIFLIVFFFFFINKPFNKISLSLTTNDPALLKSLISKKDEFGNIAALLIQHFQLQEKIINEINEKHIIEKACATAKNFIDQFCWLLKMLYLIKL
ncbi:MAG: hypothetical protein IPH11_10705 [Ignavibacteriales bacterium]|nr:hypothetical protein [Ignavibacteriales bacterium]